MGLLRDLGLATAGMSFLVHNDNVGTMHYLWPLTVYSRPF